MASDETVNPNSSLRPLTRVLLSGFLAVHVFATFLSPFHFNTIPPGGRPAPDADWLLPWFQPYINFMFLNHGYAFFAPDPPAANHLIRGTLVFDDDQADVNRQYPDRNRQRPRLLFHRHFMLTEFLHGNYPGPPPESNDDAVRENYLRSLRTYYRLKSSFENHLQVSSAAKSATVTRIEHRMIPYEVLLRESPSLNDPRTFSDLIDVPIDAPFDAQLDAAADGDVP